MGRRTHGTQSWCSVIIFLPIALMQNGRLILFTSSILLPCCKCPICLFWMVCCELFFLLFGRLSLVIHQDKSMLSHLLPFHTVFFKDNKHYGSINCVQCKWCLTATAWFFNDGSHLETIALVMSNVPCGITEVGVIKTISSFIFNSMLLPQGDGKGD